MPIALSPLRYPGGKAKLYEYVRAIIEANNLLGETYIEPFAGGAGLALKLLINGDVKKIVINDFDPAIYAFWYCVLNETDALCEFIQTVPLNINEWDKQKNIYCHPDEHSRLEIAQATFYLNRTNVSGVITGGMIGGREQDGRYKLDARFNRNDLVKRIRKIANYSDKIDLYNMDATEFLNNGTLQHYYKAFINFDPPYVEKGGQLYKNFFTETDHCKLRDNIIKCKRKWIVTYDKCEFVSKLYSKCRKSLVDINYSANGSKKAQEYVFFSKNLVIPNTIDRNVD